MATITARPAASTASVHLTIDAGADTVQRILRADANGTRPVRVQPNALPRSGTFTLTDWEPALAGPVMYRLTTSAASQASALVASVGSLLPRFLVPTLPRYALEVETVHEYDSARSSRTTTHPGINRTTPLVVLGGMGARTGKLASVFQTYQEAAALASVLSAGQVVMYRQTEHVGQDMYFSPEDLEIAPEEGNAWAMTVSYTEVPAPVGDLLASDWTFSKLAATGGTFDLVAESYDTLLALVAGS